MHPSAEVEVEFFLAAAGGRTNAPAANGRYRPHFRVAPSAELLGVCFVGNTEIALGTPCLATAVLMYPGVNYSSLKPGTKFDICEGRTVVGRGEVKALASWDENAA